MGNRRFTRKTNAFSKKFARHDATVHLTILYYDFCRIHKTLRVTPAMEAGLTDTLHNCEWIVGLVNEVEIELRQQARLEKSAKGKN